MKTFTAYLYYFLYYLFKTLWWILCISICSSVITMFIFSAWRIIGIYNIFYILKCIGLICLFLPLGIFILILLFEFINNWGYRAANHLRRRKNK